LLLIYPGSRWGDGYNERFNETLRREVLNAEWFHNTKQAQVVINAWLRQYNQIKPHHPLGMKSSVPKTLLDRATTSGNEKWS
jgi:transposase InsO family protein